jgi:hypothetical protein
MYGLIRLDIDPDFDIRRVSRTTAQRMLDQLGSRDDALRVVCDYVQPEYL